MKTGDPVYPEHLSPSCGLSPTRCLSPIHSYPPAMGAGLEVGTGERPLFPSTALGNATCCASARHPLSQTKSSWEKISTPKCRFINTQHQKSQGQGLKLAFIHHLLIWPWWGFLQRAGTVDAVMSCSSQETQHDEKIQNIHFHVPVQEYRFDW